MNLKKIQAFILVLQKESFSEAAGELGISQPAVSSLIKGLEKELGVTLLERTGSIIKATPAGQFVSDMGQEILRKWQDLEEGVKPFQNTLNGTIRIGTSTIPGTYLLPKWLGGFHQRYPYIELINEISDSSEIFNRLITKKVDVAITSSISASTLVTSETLATDALVLIAPNDHPILELEAEVDPCNLVTYPFVFREVGSGTRKAMEEKMRGYGVNLEEIKVVAQLGSTEAILSSVEAGLGISFVSKWAAYPAVQAGRVQLVPTTDVFTQSYYLSYLKGHDLLPRLKEFIDYIKDQPPVE
jgi:DNA-binding transcriptional LysR family regulator